MALKAYFQRKQSELVDMQKHLGPGVGFNHHQPALVRHALGFPDTGYAVTGPQKSHGVSYQTANNELAGLHRRGLLTRTRVGEADVFTPVPDRSGKLGDGGDR